MQVPDNLGQNLSALWKRFETPPFFADFKIVGIEFPSIQNSFFIIAEQGGSSLGLAGDKIIIGPAARIKFQVSNLSQASIDIHAEFSAPVAIGSFKFRLTGELSTDDAIDSNLAIVPIAPAVYPSLGDLMKVLLGADVHIPKGLTVADLQLGNFFQKDAFTLSMRFKEKWSLALGPAGVTVRDIAIAVVWTNSKLTASLQGTATIAGFDVKIDSNLQEQLMLRGKLPKSNLSSLIKSIAGPVLSLPSGFPDIELPEADLFIPSMANPLSFLLKTKAGDYGVVWLLIAKIDDDAAWQAAVAFELADNWKFSRLSNLLAPLDRLRIDKPKLTLATFDKSDFTFPEVDGHALKAALSRGLSLSSELKLEGLGLDFAKHLLSPLKVDRLPLLLKVVDSLSKTEVQARLAGDLKLLPGVIVFEQLFLKITPEPFAIELTAIADVTILGQELPKFSVIVGIEEGRAGIKLETVELWKNPLGIKGLTVNKVALQIKTSPAPQCGILGEIAVSDKAIMMAAQFTGAAPSMIAGELNGTLSLQEVIRDLVGLSLPGGILEISITDFKVHIVADPFAVTIGGVIFESGLALEGTIGFFGIEIESKVIVNPDKGVFIRASLKKEINLGGVLIISNADGNGPASFTLDTRKAPFLLVSGKISLLGISQSTDIVVDSKGLQIKISGNVGPISYQWDEFVSSIDNFQLTSSISFNIDERVEPVINNVRIGVANLKAGFNENALLVCKNGEFKMSISGSFELQGGIFALQAGLKQSFPELSLSVFPDLLKELPKTVKDEVIKVANALLKTCPTCKAAGSIVERIGNDCLECKASGSIIEFFNENCPTCRAVGAIDQPRMGCPLCKGSNRITCGRCDGDGKIRVQVGPFSTNVPCPLCLGSGGVSCPHNAVYIVLETIRVTCTTCNGNKTFRRSRNKICPTCNGARLLYSLVTRTCPTCNGLKVS